MQNNLKEYRIKAGLTQAEVAKIINVSYQAYAHYENGRRELRYPILKDLSKLFNCTIEGLFNPLTSNQE